MKALALTLMAIAATLISFTCEGLPLPEGGLDNLVGDLQAEGDLANTGDLQAG